MQSSVVVCAFLPPCKFSVWGARTTAAPDVVHIDSWVLRSGIVDIAILAHLVAWRKVHGQIERLGLHQ